MNRIVQDDILIMVGDQCTLEALSIRNTLEYFGYKVQVRYIGRPHDFMNILSMENKVDFLLICNHGQDGGFVMPDLGEDVYQSDEPRGLIQISDLTNQVKLKDAIVLSTACGVGYELMSKVFLDGGARAFIAPGDYVEGSAGLLFVLQYFYMYLLENNSDRAFKSAASVDNETALFRLFK